MTLRSTTLQVSELGAVTSGVDFMSITIIKRCYWPFHSTAVWKLWIWKGRRTYCITSCNLFGGMLALSAGNVSVVEVAAGAMMWPRKANFYVLELPYDLVCGIFCFFGTFRHSFVLKTTSCPQRLSVLLMKEIIGWIKASAKNLLYRYCSFDSTRTDSSALYQESRNMLDYR